MFWWTLQRDWKKLKISRKKPKDSNMDNTEMMNSWVQKKKSMLSLDLKEDQQDTIISEWNWNKFNYQVFQSR